MQINEWSHRAAFRLPQALVSFSVLALAACSPVQPLVSPEVPEVERAPAPSVSVTRVLDGDTVEVRLGDGSTDRVRLVGLDAPETRSPNRPGEFGRITDAACLDRWGDRATSYLKDKLEGRAVTLELDPREGPRDSFGRLLAYVVQGGEDINARLVELGYARVYTEGRAERKDSYQALQHAAQQAGLGLWGCASQDQSQRQAPSSPPATAPPATASTQTRFTRNGVAFLSVVAPLCGTTLRRMWPRCTMQPGPLYHKRVIRLAVYEAGKTFALSLPALERSEG